jgi:hypothetical protein
MENKYCIAGMAMIIMATKNRKNNIVTMAQRAVATAARTQARAMKGGPSRKLARLMTKMHSRRRGTFGGTRDDWEVEETQGG